MDRIDGKKRDASSPAMASPFLTDPRTSWFEHISVPPTLQNSNPFTVDVIVPAHNAASTIIPALSSSYYQSYDGLITTIVYDDSSNDLTSEIIDEYHKAHPDTLSRRLVRLASKEVGGAGGAGYARNRCVEAGSGDLLVLLDSDDVMMRERVEEQVRRLSVAKTKQGFQTGSSLASCSHLSNLHLL